jgi:Concanavalin A-like lectin/glucanases superfamily
MTEGPNPRAQIGGNDPPEEFRLQSRRSLILGAGAAFIARPALALPSVCRGPFAQRKIGPVNPQCLTVPQGLVGYWPLGADTTDFHQGLTFDISGNGNTGTLTALTASSLAQALVGTGLTFNGTSSFITLPASATNTLQPPLPLTLSGWVNITSFAENGCIINLGGGGANYAGVYLALSTSGNVVIAIGNNTSSGSTGRLTVVSTPTVTTGSWAFIAATITSATAAGVIIYINGLAVATTSSGTASTLVYGTTTNLIGKYNNLASIGVLSGTVFGVRCANRALAPPEILSLDQDGLVGSRTPYPLRKSI